MAATTGSSVHMWVPFKDLYLVVTSAIQRKQPDAIQDIDSVLRKHKPDFISLLKNPAKNSVHRNAVNKADREGILIQGQSKPQLLSRDFINEALIISDLFDLNEYAAVELLLAGESQLGYFPGLSRGVVAVILYYDGRVSLVNSLRILIQAHEGRTWTLGLTSELAMTINKYTDQLMSEGMMLHILDLLKTLDTTKQIESLQKEKALGPPRYKRQVYNLIEEVEMSLAECLFCWACQTPLNKENTLQLVSHLQQIEATDTPDHALSAVNLALVMALLYSVDVRLLEHDDSPDIMDRLPLLSDQSFIPDLHDVISSTTAWKIPELKALVQFTWAVTLRALSQYPYIAGLNEFCEHDETLIQNAIDDDVFGFITNSIFAVKGFYTEEFYLRQIHNIIADFIALMPLKIKELRNQGDETSRIIMAHAQAGLDPPNNLPRYFEQFMKLISDLYSEDPLELELALEYWCPFDTASTANTTIDYNQSFQQKPPQRQISLNKFVRQAGDLLPPTLYIPYIEMLTGLANGPQCAHHCYNLLKGGHNSAVTWDHFFLSMNQYCTNMRQEHTTTAPSDMAHIYHNYPTRNINPQEIQGLVVVLKLIQRVAQQDETARISMCENQQWLPLVVLLGLISCSIPAYLKAELLHTISALVRSSEIATTFWQTLEVSQILQTVAPSSIHQGASGMLVELNDVEASAEEFPLTRSFISLLDVLTNVPVPQALGAGHRAPGFHPYLDFIIDAVFLKFHTRSYKNAAERWQVAVSCLQIMYKLLSGYEVTAEDFTDQYLELQTGGGLVAVNKPPGYTLMCYILADNHLLKTILYIIDEGTKHLDMYKEFEGKSALEEACLLSLKVLCSVFEKQENFMTALRDSGATLLVSNLDKLLLTVNRRTGQPDHLVTITKYVTYNSTLCEHTYEAVKILCWFTQCSYAQQELVGLFTSNEALSRELLHGFVECLESEDVEGEQIDDDEDIGKSQIRNFTRHRIIQVMLYAMEQPSPNLAHFLLGFQLRTPISKTNLQDPGVLGSSRSCLHSVLGILERGVGSHYGPTCCYETPVLAELCYRLIYTLCSNKDTCTPVLRYLRTTQDFLHKHLVHIPFTLPEGGNWPQATEQLLLSQQSWLLKSIATELRMTSLNRQRSHTQRLVHALLDDSPATHNKLLQADGVYEPDYSNYDLEFSTFANTQSYIQQTMIGGQTRRKLLAMLETIDFKQSQYQVPTLSIIEPGLVQQIVDACATHNSSEGLTYCNIKKLHHLLNTELTQRHGGAVASQKSAIYQDIECVCKSMVERNQTQQLVYTKRCVFDAWRQVVEIVLNACPDDILTNEQRTSAVFEILQDLLKKVSEEDSGTEMSGPVAGVILTLMSNLRLCFLQRSVDTNTTMQPLLNATTDHMLAGVGLRGTGQLSNASLLDAAVSFKSNASLSAAGAAVGGYDQYSAANIAQYASSLQIVLTGLVEYIIKSTSTMQRVRVNLYGALLYFLQIAQKPRTQQMLDRLQGGDISSSSRGVGAGVLLGAAEIDQVTQSNMATISSYGDSFMDIVCRDACDGHHICRMIALSTLDAMLMADTQQIWLTFMSSKGYIQHFVDSLLDDNEQLQNIVTAPQHQQPVRTLYIYQSKMSVLMRMAGSVSGAHTLLQSSLMSRLAQCSMYDMRPDANRVDDSGSESLGITMMSTYQDLLFPALRLCLALLTSTGIENRDARNQVLHFVLGHIELFSAVLSDHRGSFSSEEAYLRELTLVTAVVSRTAIDDDTEGLLQLEMAGVELRNHLSHLEQLMLALLPRYSRLDRYQTAAAKATHYTAPSTTAKLARDDKSERVRGLVLEVLGNVTTFGRSVIANSARTAALTRILFAPHLGDNLPTEERPRLLSMHGRAPSLAMLLSLLVQCIEQFNVSLDTHKQYTRKLESLPSLTSEEIKELCSISDESMTNQQQQQQLAKRIVTKLILHKSKECTHLGYIIENCLYMLWRHLDYYLVYCVPSNQSTALNKLSMRKQLRKLTDMTGFTSPDVSLLDSSQGARANGSASNVNSTVTAEQLEQLKRDMSVSLNEALFKRIRDMEQCYSRNRSHYGFVDALVRRIKGLVHLHST